MSSSWKFFLGTLFAAVTSAWIVGVVLAAGGTSHTPTIEHSPSIPPSHTSSGMKPKPHLPKRCPHKQCR
jgi:hypothetical protein